MFIFPYSEIEKGSNVIVYGAGDVGGQYIKQIQLTGFCKIQAVVDRNWENIGRVCGIKINSPDIEDYSGADAVIVAIENPGVSKSICEMLATKGVSNIINFLTRFTGADDSMHFMEYQSFTLDKNCTNPNVDILSEDKAGALKELLTQFVIKNYEGMEFERISGEADGGYVMDGKLQGGHVAYSIGIGDEISWDAEMAKRGFDIYMYDYTVDHLPFINERFHFIKKGITGQTSKDPVFCTLSEALQVNGHMNEKHMILKMDIEGAEWDVFENEKENVFERFDQLVFEIHNLLKTDKWGYYAKCLERLRRTHELVHIHANNVSRFALIDGLKLADCMELTYIKKEGRKYYASREILPSYLDRPNIYGLTEIELGDWNYLINRLFHEEDR